MSGETIGAISKDETFIEEHGPDRLSRKFGNELPSNA